METEDTRRISHDDDQLSTKPKRRKRRDQEDDGIMERQIFEGESLFEDIVCYVLYLIVGVL